LRSFGVSLWMRLILHYPSGVTSPTHLFDK
jgi:hypothetical protein